MINETWPPGWYQDPWAAEQSRYWNGTEWTPDVRPGLPPTTPMPIAPARRSRVWWVIGGAVLVAVAVIAGLIAALRPSSSHNSAASPIAPGTFPTAPTTAPPPPVSSDPDANRLPLLGLRPSDAPRGDFLGPIPSGNRVGTGDAATLNLCDLTFASESQRTARYQLALADPQDSTVFSTEAVLYGTGNGTAQAFSELRGVPARCPPASGSVTPADQRTGPTTAGVERLAFNVVSVDNQGNRDNSVVVYLRRGRALLGLYFYVTTGPQPAVGGRTTVPGIVQVFATRLSRLPNSAIASPGAVDFHYPSSGNG